VVNCNVLQRLDLRVKTPGGVIEYLLDTLLGKLIRRDEDDGHNGAGC